MNMWSVMYHLCGLLSGAAFLFQLVESRPCEVWAGCGFCEKPTLAPALSGSDSRTSETAPQQTALFLCHGSNIELQVRSQTLMGAPTCSDELQTAGGGPARSRGTCARTGTSLA